MPVFVLHTNNLDYPQVKDKTDMLHYSLYCLECNEIKEPDNYTKCCDACNVKFSAFPKKGNKYIFQYLDKLSIIYPFLTIFAYIFSEFLTTIFGGLILLILLLVVMIFLQSLKPYILKLFKRTDEKYERVHWNRLVIPFESHFLYIRFLFSSMLLIILMFPAMIDPDSILSYLVTCIVVAALLILRVKYFEPKFRKKESLMVENIRKSQETVDKEEVIAHLHKLPIYSLVLNVI